MKLLTMHRILVAAAIAFSAFFLWYQGRIWRATGSRGALAIAIGCGVLAAALSWYLANLRRYVRIEPPARGPEP